MKAFLVSLWKGLRGGMMRFGDDIATLVNSLLLLLVYLLGVGVTAIAAKMVGKRFLDRKPKSAKSYWRDVSAKRPEPESEFRQF